MSNGFRIYQGRGEKPDEPIRLPDFERPDRITDPALYIADPGLRDAVNVALLLGQPLLLTGEPGTGKTQLAFSIAGELNLPGPFVFHTKTDSTAADLFYTYDALQHFQESQMGAPRPVIEYIRFRALGLAILSAGDPERSNRYLSEADRIEHPQRSVVLIDEIDKAPRDLPNDVLDELENMRFRVPELKEEFRSEPRYRPVVILTSNSERDLPEPFLRRCVYYHIPFPADEELRRIIRNRLGSEGHLSGARLDRALALFGEIRKRARKKRPGTAELLGWLQVLDRLELDPDPQRLSAEQRELLSISYTVLLKAKDDLEREQETLAGGG